MLALLKLHRFYFLFGKGRTPLEDVDERCWNRPWLSLCSSADRERAEGFWPNQRAKLYKPRCGNQAERRPPHSARARNYQNNGSHSEELGNYEFIVPRQHHVGITAKLSKLEHFSGLFCQPSKGWADAHDFKQILPGRKMQPIFQISLLCDMSI